MGYAIKRQPNAIVQLADTDLMRVSDATTGNEKRCTLTTLSEYISTGEGTDPNTGVTAFAGGGQGSATELEGGLNVVSTVATAADSVKLIAGASTIQVINGGANDLGVFPESGAAIDDFGSNGVYYLAPGSSQSFVRTSDTTWTRLNRALRHVDRGDSADWDFDETDLTVQNGTWTDLDVSAIVPLSAAGKPVEWRLRIKDAADVTFALRSKDDTDGRNALAVATLAADISNNASGYIGCNDSRVVQYFISASVGLAESFIRGWWVEG